MDHEDGGGSLLARAAGDRPSAREARFLRWHVHCDDPQGALDFAVLRKRAAAQKKDEKARMFWAEVEACLRLLDADRCAELISLVAHVDGLHPRGRWISPILEGVFCRDFRTQLLAALEDCRRESVKK